MTLNEILMAHGISEEEILRRSARLERWRPEDRTAAHARARLRTSGERGYRESGLDKPRTGRGIGRKHLRAALAGRAVPRLPRGKLRRALADALRRRGVLDVPTSLSGSPGDLTSGSFLEARS